MIEVRKSSHQDDRLIVEEQVAMGSFNDLSAETIGFLRWWDDARGGKLLPDRVDLDLSLIAEHMSRMTVIDAVAPDRMMFRLTGTEIDEQAGTNPTGLNVLDITAEADREMRGKRLWHMASTPCIGAFWFQGRFPASGEAPAEGLTLPVTRGRDNPIQFFSIFHRYRASVERADQEVELRQVMPTLFSYVDIGNGTPEDGSGERLPLSALYGEG